MDNAELFLKSSVGIQFKNPFVSFTLVENKQIPYSLWMKKRYILVGKLMKRKAYINRFIVAILTIIFGVLVIVAVCVGGWLLQSEMFSFLFGFVGGFAILLFYEWMLTFFECSIFHTTIKRRGREYNSWCI